ncbi:acetate uptake transporter [Streptomyces sp. NPDC085946]|uniref:acetate uptake transporter n=1 Tax=Streptomyces sp. NPDC085946 TaxID=3365744 RepID=UPI0037CEE180
MTSHTHQAPADQHTQDRDEPRLASPDTLGLWAFALGTFMGNLPDTGRVERAGLDTCVAVFLGGGAQPLAGLRGYRTRNAFGATSFTAFGLFWITIGAFGNLAVSTRAGSWLLIACATAAAYTATAQFWNTVHRRNVLPLGEPTRPDVRSRTRPPRPSHRPGDPSNTEAAGRLVQAPSPKKAPKCPCSEENR